MAASDVIRCPVCLSSQPMPQDTPANKRIYCGTCRQNFNYGEGLTLDGIKPVVSRETAPQPASNIHVNKTTGFSARDMFIILAGIILFIFTVFPARLYVQDMRGTEFLTFYVIFFIVIWLSVVIFRTWLDSNSFVTYIGLIIFEAVGVFRYIDASAAGMSKFSYMYMIMFFGAVLLFLRMKDSSDFSRGNNCSGCSSCSSCSGCGSSCGGCGGCGD